MAKNLFAHLFVSTTLAVVAWFPKAVNAQIGEWTAHTSFQEAVAVDYAPDHIWVATTGGVYSVDRLSGEIVRYTIVDGLHTISPQALAYDANRSVVWLGYVDGALDRIDPASERIDTYLDVLRADQFAQRGINRIRVSGDSLLLSTDFGAVIFDPVLNEVRDSYTRFGSLPPATGVNDINLSSAGDSIFVATQGGVAFAQTSALNLQDPASWTYEEFEVGRVTAVSEFDGLIYAGTDVGLFVRRSATNYEHIGISDRIVTDLFETDDVLFGTERFRVFGIFPEGGKSFLSTGFSNPSAIRADAGEIIVADSVDGLIRLDAPRFSDTNVNVTEIVVPEGPTDGIFSDLVVAEDGKLLAGGSAKSTSGFYTLTTDGDWTSYAGTQISELAGTSRYTSVHQDATGNVWAASEGGGVALVDIDGVVSRFSDDNSTLLSPSGFSGFVIAAGVTTDRDNNLWVSTKGSTEPIHIRQPDGQWTGRGPLIGDGLNASSTTFDSIYNDSFNQKWIIVHDPTAFNVPIGLIVLDDSGTPLDFADDFFRYFRQRGSAGQGLPSNRITSVVEDKNGLIWVGTEEGPAYFVNTGIVARDAGATPIWPQLADRSDGVFLYLGLQINDIAVDPANRLWFATNEGVRVVRELEGGFEEIAHLTSDNSPLPSNVIVSIAIRDQTGEVFIATESGMTSTTTDAVAASSSVKDLTVFPNPVRVVDGDSPAITIDGLTDETTLRIATVDGSVIRTYSTRGGRVQWDGRDRSGELVPSGMYLIIAVSERGEKTAYGKVAVIN